MTISGPTGENGTPNKRKYRSSRSLEIVDAGTRTAVSPIAELRRTPEGKDALRAAGRDSAEAERRPGATMQRRFIAWDGEGITRRAGRAQDYVLFGCSAGYSIQGRSLSTVDCLELMISAEADNPDAYHVGFAFNYDVNMILKDVPRARLERLRNKKRIRWLDYAIEWYPSKWFQVSKGPKAARVTCRIWDVWGFFQSSFVAALSSYLGEREEIAQIEAGKLRRGSFDDSEIGFIESYWRLELDLLVLLVSRLRTYLYSAGLYVTQWHGPGAIASYAFRQHSITSAMGVCPDAVNDAAQYAYAGGRFELFCIGRYLGKAFSTTSGPHIPKRLANSLRSPTEFGARPTILNPNGGLPSTKSVCAAPSWTRQYRTRCSFATTNPAFITRRYWRAGTGRRKSPTSTPGRNAKF